MDPYALIAQMPNAGQAFSDAFQKGQQQNALASFAQNPNPQTAGAAARYDPGAVLQYNLEAQKQKGVQSQQQLEEWHKYAGNLAQWADTPEKRDQAIDHLLSHNHPDISTEALLALKTIPPEQWQSVRANFMALGGVHDEAGVGQPKIIPVQPGGSVMSYDPVTQTMKQLVAPNDGSQPTGAPTASGGGDLRAQAAHAIQMGADPVKVMQRLQQMQGGQAATPSATFPGPH